MVSRVRVMGKRRMRSEGGVKKTTPLISSCHHALTPMIMLRAVE